jgi:predicted TIM-barrel fold metal-dependent hydrolase
MHTYKIAHPFIVRVCRLCGSLGLPVMLHHTGQWADEMGSVPELVRQCPDVNFIVPNPTWTAGAVALLKNFGNVYYDISKSYGAVTYRILAEAVGTRRLLFGTETPKMDPGLELAKLRAFAFTDAQLQDVVFRNAARLLHVS